MVFYLGKLGFFFSLASWFVISGGREANSLVGRSWRLSGVLSGFQSFLPKRFPSYLELSLDVSARE